MKVTGPKYNTPTQARCDICGKVFMKQPWSGVYSKNGRLVTVCPSCEQKLGPEFGRLMY